MAKVFVVTPTYCTEENGRIAQLMQTLYWVQQQTHRDYLHIVVDDGSTDATPEILQRLSRADPKLEVFRKQNGGSSAAINYGVEQGLALGKPDYITVCHSDDLLPPESLDLRVKLASRTGADFVYTDEAFFYDSGRPSRLHRALEYSSSRELFGALLRHRAIPYTTMFWSADFFRYELQGFDHRITSAEDWDIAIRSAKHLVAVQGSHAILHEVTAARRWHEGRLSAQNLRDGTKRKCYEMILRKHLSGREYVAAMTLERFTRLVRPKLLRKVANWVRPRNPKPEADASTRALLEHMKGAGRGSAATRPSVQSAQSPSRGL